MTITLSAWSIFGIGVLVGVVIGVVGMFVTGYWFYKQQNGSVEPGDKSPEGADGSE